MIWKVTSQRGQPVAGVDGGHVFRIAEVDWRANTIVTIVSAILSAMWVSLLSLWGRGERDPGNEVEELVQLMKYVRESPKIRLAITLREKELLAFELVKQLLY